MRINTHARDGIVIIEPMGRVTVETEAQFTEALRRLIEEGQRYLVLNLAAVPYIDSVGLGCIVQAYTSVRRRGGDLKLLNLRDHNRRLMEITKLLTVFEAYDTEGDVEASFPVNGPEVAA